VIGLYTSFVAFISEVCYIAGIVLDGCNV